MDIKIVNGVAVVTGREILITDAQSMLDLIATVQYDHGCDRIALYKEALTEDFFKLATGLAGEILQKVVNYRKKLAVIGDFAAYTGKPLRDFIYESNKGSAVFFVRTEAEAVMKLQ
ncbi:MAG: DUF4180 domain-containing protein [Oscillospiraceae bacterium]|jgi:hypothetical protein|nr:DUF4180 domain-containing protein [Oscillospiraceae bacterium]